jgi:hypothetical protein
MPGSGGVTHGRDPSPRHPADLGAGLHGGIPRTPAFPAPQPTPQPSWQRWWPIALPGLAVVALVALVVVQHRELRSLNARSSKITPTPELATSATGNGELPIAPDPRADPSAVPEPDPRAELERLRARVNELTESVAGLNSLKRDIARMEVESTLWHVGVPPEVGDIPQARDWALRIICVNHLKQLGLATRLFASDHSDEFPGDFAQLVPYLGAWINSSQVFVCPADETRPVASDAASFMMAHSSYEFLAGGSGNFESEPPRVLFRGPIHGSVALCDTSVHQLDADQQRRLVRRDGKLYLENPAPVAPAPQP